MDTTSSSQLAVDCTDPSRYQSACRYGWVDGRWTATVDGKDSKKHNGRATRH